MRNLAIITIAALVFAVSSAHAAEPVTACGERVGDGVLTADLDCSGIVGDAVQVESSLALAGFTLKAGVDSGQAYAVHCLRHGSDEEGLCEVSGPGTIEGSGTGRGNHGVQGSKVRAQGVTFTGNQTAVIARRSTVRDCTINGVGGTGIWGGATRVNNTQITDSGDWGIVVLRRAVLKHSTVTGSVLDGIACGGNVTLVDSEVTGNAVDVDACENVLGSFHCSQEPQPWLCADISAEGRVTLGSTSSCGRSLVQTGSCSGAFDLRPGQSFGVCAGD